MLPELIEKITPSDKQVYEACIRRFNCIAKPIRGLGELEKLIARIGAITGSIDIDISKKCILVFCADNGVASQNVAQCDSSVTASIAKMLASGKASVCVMAAVAGADVIPIDMGMKYHIPGLINHRLMAGTNDISTGPAMTPQCAQGAINIGISFVERQKKAGYQLVGTGEAGIGNTTTSAAMASLLLCIPPEIVTGRGAGLSDDGLQRKISAVHHAIQVNHPDTDDPLDILSKVGGLDIAAMAGVFIGGALYHIPIVMDGIISSVAALTAVRLCPHVRDYILPSHISTDPAGPMLASELGFAPILHADMHLGEGTGAATLFPLLDMAAAVYSKAARFDEISLEAYSTNP